MTDRHLHVIAPQVPEILGQNKNLAEYFQNQWKRLVGSCDLVFTRTIEGRKLLLKIKN